MSDQRPYELQLSFKTAGGTLINVPADTPDEASAKLDHLANLAPKIASTEALLVGASHAGSVAAPPAQQPVTQPAPPAEQPQAASGGWGGPPQPPAAPAAAAAPAAGQVCPHGARVWKTGVSKVTNKPWAAWMCPAPKGTPGQCDPEWDRSYGK